MANKKKFWFTLPGILTGIASIITAVAGLIAILYQLDVIGPKASESQSPESEIVLESQKALQSLRKKNNVRPLHDLENGLDLSKLPNGIFGFYIPWADFNSDITLDQHSGGTAVVEFHKLLNGQLVIVGFVSQENILRLQATTTNVSIKFFPEPWEEAHTIIAIPVDRVLSKDDRTFQSGYVLDLMVAPLTNDE